MNPLKNAFWEKLDAQGNRSAIANSGVPLLLVSGWFDIHIFSNLREFKTLTDLAPANNKPKIIIGPWAHSHLGDSLQGGSSYPAAEFGDSLQVLDFFDYYLRNVTSQNYPSKYATIRYFRVDENIFLNSSSWPIPDSAPTSLFFQGDGSIRTAPPAESVSFREYLSSPLTPMKTKYGRLLNETSGYGLQGAGEIGEYLSRPDQVSYSTGVLSHPMRIDGNIVLSVWVSIETLGVVDTDIHVRLIHAYSNGSKIGLTDGARRLSLRNGYSVSEPLSASALSGPFKLDIDLYPISMFLPAGDSLVIMLASSNNNEFEVNYQDGSKHVDDLGAAPLNGTIRIWTDATHPSFISLPLLSPLPQPTSPSTPPAAAEPPRPPPSRAPLQSSSPPVMFQHCLIAFCGAVLCSLLWRVPQARCENK